MEEETSGRTQRNYTNLFLGSIGLNRDLFQAPRRFRAAPIEEPHAMDQLTATVCYEGPENLAADLFQCSANTSKFTYTVEDKDPSILWRMAIQSIFNM